MKLVIGVTGDSDRPRFLWMLELTVTSLLTGNVPAVVMEHAEEVANLHRPSLADGGGGEAGGAAVGGLEEVNSGGAILGVGLEFVLKVGDGAVFGAALEELERAVAVLAAKLGVGIVEGIGDGFELPEGFVTAGGTNPTTLDLALLKVFAFSCHERPRSVP
jgi:hypothetical protein